MKTIIGTARVVDSSDNGVSGLNVALEVFDIKTGRWSVLANDRTDADGKVGFKWVQGNTRPRFSGAPALRITQKVGRRSSVLANGGSLRFSRQNQTLTIDFGEVDQVGFVAIRREIVMLRNNDVRLRRDIDTKKVQLQRANTELTNTKSTLSSTKRNLQDATQKLQRANDNLATLREKLADAERAQPESAGVDAAQSEIRALKASLERLNNETTRRTPIQDIAKNFGEQVDSANQTLRSSERGFQLGKIKLDLRGTVSSDGKAMALANSVDIEKMRDGVFSGVEMEILPLAPPPASAEEIVVPDLQGLTEIAARRVLLSLGLKLASVTRTVSESSDIAAGQSLEQTPVPGAKLKRDQSVLVVFAVPESPAENV